MWLAAAMAKALADTFRQMVGELPDDWTDLEFDLLMLVAPILRKLARAESPG